MKTLITRTLVVLLAFLVGANTFGLYQPAVSAASGPDLIVQGITLSPAEPALDDTVTVTVAVKNQGNAVAADNFLTCYIDDSILDNRLIESLNPGMMATVAFTWHAAGGSHTVKAIADFNGTVSETNENNNTGTYSFTTLAADLTVQSITWTPVNPSRDDHIVFSITVKNRGTGRSRPTSINFYIDGSTRGLQDVAAINPGETLLKTYTWVATSGDHTLKAAVDEMNSVEESNDANNELSVSFITLPPDLTIQGIVWTPANPSKDDTVLFSVTIKNQGTGRADSSHLGYYIDDEFMAAVSVPALDAGDSCNVTFSWAAAVAAHDILAVIDYYRMINESIETNNELKVSLLTAAPDLVISNMTWLPASAAAGDLITIAISLKNEGGGRAEASRAALYMDGAIFKYLDFIAIEAGAEQTVEFTWVAESGTHAVSIMADYAERIMENREDNNRYAASIPVLPPDLVISGITYLPEKPSLDDTVIITISISNQGIGRAAGFRLACYIDDNRESVETVSPLASGATANATFAWKIQTGRHVFKAYADYDNALLEENEKNNTGTIDIAPDMPDLSITDVTWSPPDFTPGRENDFVITIENIGIMDAGASRIVYYVDGVLAGFNDIDPIAAGDKLTRTFTWTALEGRHAISIVADSKAQITEIDETNNTIVVDIPPPDLIAQDITFSPQDILSGDTVVINASIKNQGANRTQNSVAACYVDGSVIGSNDVPPVDAGDTYTSTFEWAAAPGTHTVKICADVTNRVIETDETNNEIETAFSTLSADLAVDSISWLVDNQLSSNEVSFTIIIGNSGAVPSGGFSVKYWFDDAQETLREIESVPAASTTEFTFTAILSEGLHTASIIVDTEDAVSELDETDNKSEFSFSTTAPDLLVRSISWSPLTAAIGENITISANIENRGGEKAVATRLSLSIDGVNTGFVDIPEIDAGAAEAADFSWTAVEGDHEITIMADAGRLIQESNEKNNAKSRTISFTKQAVPEKKSPVITTGASTGGGLLEDWWWMLLLVGGLLGLGMLYSTIKNLRKR